jgi:hypothetical protein
MSSLSATTAARAGEAPLPVAGEAPPKKVSARMRITHLVSYSRIPFLPTAQCSQTQQKCHPTGMTFCADVGIRCERDDAAHLIRKIALHGGFRGRLSSSGAGHAMLDVTQQRDTPPATMHPVENGTRARAAQNAGAHIGTCVIDADTCVCTERLTST